MGIYGVSLLNMSTKRQPISEQLRRAILASGMSRYRICKEIGIGQPSMSRFMAGIAGLSLETIDALAELLGLELRPAVKGKVTRGKRG